MNRSAFLQRVEQTLAARGNAYGGAHAGLRRVADLWSVILDRPVFPHEVALCLDAMKTARILHDPTSLDSWLDKAGYSALGAEVISGEQ